MIRKDSTQSNVYIGRSVALGTLSLTFSVQLCEIYWVMPKSQLRQKFIDINLFPPDRFPARNRKLASSRTKSPPLKWKGSWISNLDIHIWLTKNWLCWSLIQGPSYTLPQADNNMIKQLKIRKYRVSESSGSVLSTSLNSLWNLAS